jgi:hypothetical protein
MGQKHCCEVNLNLPITLVFRGESMPQTVKITVTLNINPAAPPPPPPLVASPATVSLPDETVGTAVTNVPVATVSGGTPPYQPPVVDPASPNPLPPGLSFAIDGSGNVTVSGTPGAAGSGTFVLDVSDSGA